MTKIGVGVITTPKRKINPNIYKHTQPDTLIYIHIDEDRLGVSKSRNNCIKYLYDQNCDYIFLFDDDCYPIMIGWEQCFIDAHLSSNIHHFTISESFKSKLLRIDNDIHYYDGALGCFRFLTRQLVDKIGFFNTKYDKYGFEDAAYTYRALKLYNHQNEYPTPNRSMFFIHSEDVYGENPNINYSYEEKMILIEKNRPIYIEEITSDNLYLPYNQ